LYRLHGRKYYGEDILKIHEGRVEPLLELMRDLDVGLEINTKAVRKGLPEYYPAMTIVNTARSLGARIVSIGSDAHCPEEVAYDFEMASAVAYDLYPYTDE
jgi:histidinol-phosphatase (PHP family)